MSQPVLRRPIIPRLHARLPCHSALPTFLMEGRALPMTPQPVMGPQDRLEAAIMQGQVWDTQTDPVEFDSFDAEDEVISIIVEEGDEDLQLNVLEGAGRIEILANGKPMARVDATGHPFSSSNIKVLQPRSSI
ncbi:MAG: hypothetical protein AAF641_13765 [Pseudomonadota bacterium]